MTSSSVRAGRPAGRAARDLDDRTDAVHERVLIAQNLFDGHRLMFVALLADAVRARGGEPVLLLAEGASASPDFAEHLAASVDGVRIDEVPVVDGPTIRRHVEVVGARRVVLPDGDVLLPYFARHGWDRTVALSALVMRPDGQPSANPVRTLAATVAKRALRAAVRLRTGGRVLVLVNGLRPKVRGNEVRDPVLVASVRPDRIPLTDEAGSGGDRYWFGVVGAITPRKNLHLVAAALQRLDARRTGLAVVGRCDPEAMALATPELEAFRSAGGALLVRDELVTDELFESVLASVDCAVVAHSNEGASGVLVRAAVFGTRVVTAGARSLRRDAGDLRGVATWVPLEVDALAGAFRIALGQPRPARRSVPDEQPLAALLDGAA